MPTSPEELNDYYPTPAGRNAADLYLQAADLLIDWDSKNVPPEMKYPLGLDSEPYQPPPAPDPNNPMFTAGMGRYGMEGGYGMGGHGGFEMGGYGMGPWNRVPDDWQEENSDLLPVIGMAAWPESGKELHPITRAAIEDYLADNEPALKRLYEAAGIPECRYPVDFSNDLNAILTDSPLGATRYCAKLLTLQMLYHLEQRNCIAAMEDLRTQIAVGNSLRGEPMLISYLVQIDVQRLMVDSLNSMINSCSLSDEQLEELQALLDSLYVKDGFKRAFAGEHIFALNTLWDRTIPRIRMYHQHCWPFCVLRGKYMLKH